MNLNYDETRDDFTYIVGIADINFMGRNQSFFLGNAFGSEKVYFLGLNNPWIFGDHISFEIEFQNRKSQNIFYEFVKKVTQALLTTRIFLKQIPLA